MHATSQGTGSSYECKHKILAVNFNAVKYVCIRVTVHKKLLLTYF